MAPVVGRPFIEWVVRFLGKQGIGRIALATGYRGELIAEHFAQRSVPKVEVCCIQETEPYGTAGGFRNTARLSGWEPHVWLVMNGDSLVYAPLASFAAELTDPAIGGMIVGVQVSDGSRYGVISVNEAGALRAFEEKRPGAALINAGVYFLKPEVISLFPASRCLSFEQDVFPELTRGGTQLKVKSCSAPFLDIGTPESLPQADEFIRAHLDQFLEP